MLKPHHSSPQEEASTGAPEIVSRFIRSLKADGDPCGVLGDYEHLQTMYEAGELVDALEGETLVFRGGKLTARLVHGESFVAKENNESRIPYMH